ncbi:MAG: hypothetical protein U9Q72_02445 [Patescibacteria group bacterium]|nr:hypothetical protein [Patescibacteria group bacterium]
MDSLVVHFKDLLDFTAYWWQGVFIFASHWWWIFLPVILFRVLYDLWMYDIGFRYATENKYAILTIRVPREEERSPKLMENVLHGFWTLYGNVRNFMDTLVLGIKPDYASLEIIGTEGKIYYGVRLLAGKVDFFKSHIYAQYPEAEIEVLGEDYVDLVPDNAVDNGWKVWGTIFAPTKNDAYPIRTYPEFQDSVTGTMIDPIASYMEVLSDLGPGEFIWYQLLMEPVQAHVWYDEAQQEVERILDRGGYKEKNVLGKQIMKDLLSFPKETLQAAFKYPETVSAEDADKVSPMLKLSPGEQDSLKAIERNISKRSFRSQYSAIYIAREENFKPKNISAMMGAVNQFATNDLNELTVYKPYITSFAYWFTDRRNDYAKRRLLKVLKRRQFTGKSHILNTEEIASLWHFPDVSVKAAQTPRVAAKKVAAPTNLPTNSN